MVKKGITTMIDSIKSLSVRDYLSWVAGVVIATILALGWANTNFMTAAKAEVTHKEILKAMSDADIDQAKQIQQLAEEAAETNQLIIVLTSKAELGQVKNAIKANESDQFSVGQYIRVNGSDEVSEKRLQQLKLERSDLEIKRQCIIAKNPICE